MRRRRLVLAVITLSALFAAAAAGLYLSRRGPAPDAAGPVALVLVEPRPVGLLPGGPPPLPSDVEEYRRTRAALVRSPFVVNAALREARVRDLEVVRRQSDPAAWLAGRLTAEYAGGGWVLRVGVTDVPAAEAAALANAVATAYVAEVGQAEANERRDRLRRLEDTQAELAAALEARRGALNQLAAAAGVPAESADHRALLAALYRERGDLRVELARARAAGGGEKVLRDELVALDERVAACARADLDAARAEVDRLREAVAAVAAEALRARVELNAPPRVRLAELASAPPE